LFAELGEFTCHLTFKEEAKSDEISVVASVKAYDSSDATGDVVLVYC
jgi:hypothetical protein